MFVPRILLVDDLRDILKLLHSTLNTMAHATDPPADDLLNGQDQAVRLERFAIVRDAPTGCRIHPRCPTAVDICNLVVPEWLNFRRYTGLPATLHNRLKRI